MAAHAVRFDEIRGIEGLSREHRVHPLFADRPPAD
jgi:hypothetical protein